MKRIIRFLYWFVMSVLFVFIIMREHKISKTKTVRYTDINGVSLKEYKI